MIKGMRRALAERPRLRIVVLIVVIILVLVIGARFMTSSAPVPVGSGVEASNIGNQVGGRPQGALPQQKSRYKNLSDKTKQQNLKHVASSGSSYFNGIFSNGHKVKPHTAVIPSKPVVPVATPKPQTQQGENPVNFMHQNDQQNASGQSDNNSYNSAGNAAEQKDHLSALQEAMRAQLMGKSSSNLPTQQAVVGVALPAPKAANSTPGKVIIKAGTIQFAVLDTALNSDQPGTPVLAKIVSGKYRGSRLMGSFVREKDKLVVRFSRMNIPNRATTLAINAFAISAKTAQNALASSVNHHYLYRYGSLFAAGFLQGFGNAFQTTQPTCPPGTPCTIVGNADATRATTQQAVYQGLGQVGSNWSNALENNFNTPPTVKLDQGVGMGILFMTDVNLNNQSNLSNINSGVSGHASQAKKSFNGLLKD